MNQIVHATFEDGVLKPDVPLEFPPMTRVRLTVEPLTTLGPAMTPEQSSAWTELDQLWDDVDVDSAAPRPNRDQLYDRH
jgi:predicted DNA-binding antitoxin AbrB/MazE fold protein